MGYQASKNGATLFFELAAHLWGFSFVVLYRPFLGSSENSYFCSSGSEGFPPCVLFCSWLLLSSPEKAAFLCCHVDIVCEVQ